MTDLLKFLGQTSGHVVLLGNALHSSEECIHRYTRMSVSVVDSLNHMTRSLGTVFIFHLDGIMIRSDQSLQKVLLKQFFNTGFFF